MQRPDFSRIPQARKGRRKPPNLRLARFCRRLTCPWRRGRWRRCRCGTLRASRARVMMEMNCSILEVRPVISNTKCSVEASITLARKISAMPQRLDALVALARHFDQRQLALQRLAEHRQIDDAVHIHQPLELALDLRQHLRRAGGDDGEARQMLLVLGLRHRQAIDVVATAREQTGDAREHARLVVDQDGEACASRACPCAPRGSRRSRAGCWAWSCLVDRCLSPVTSRKCRMQPRLSMTAGRRSLAAVMDHPRLGTEG